MKKIIVFGATGGTGRELVKQALEHGYEVVAVLRGTSRFELKNNNLRMIVGDVTNQTFEKSMAGVDAVVSCLGTSGSTQPTNVYSKGMKNILSSMQKSGATRLITITAGALDVNNKMSYFVQFLTRFILQKVLREMYSDMRTMESIVKESSVDWTIVRPSRLTNKTFTGRYRISINSNLRRPWSIGRADLAAYMIKCIDDRETYSSVVEISD
jgi:putative NADH-flavin reductase